MEVIKRTVCNTVLACLREEEADMASIYSWGSKQVFENYHVAHQIFADYWEYLNIMNLDANVPLEAQDVRVRLRLGEVIRNILFLNQSYFDNIQVLFTRMRRTITDLTEMTEHIGKTAVECISGTSLVSQKCMSPMGISDCDPNDLKKLKQSVNSFLEGLQQLIHVTGMDEVLGQLLISLCLNRGYMKAYAKARKLQLTVQEQSVFQLGKIQQEEWSDFTLVKKKALAAQQAQEMLLFWQCLINIISSSDYLDRCDAFMLGIVGVVEELFRELEKEIDNLRGLKDNLEKSLDDRTVWESIKNCAQNVAVVSDEETEYFFSGYLLKQRKCSGAYAIFGIKEVVALEVKRIDDLGRELRKCEKCGRYFVPVQFGADNCGYPNPDYGNKSCGAIAKNEKYIMNIKGDPISSEFAIRRRNFCQWKRDQFRGKNIGLLREEIDILMKKDGDVKNNVDDYIDKIRTQIEESYQSWIKRCENAIYELRNGNISEDECKNQFEIFSIGEINVYTKGKYGGVSELLDYVRYYSRV